MLVYRMIVLPMNRMVVQPILTHPIKCTFIRFLKPLVVANRFELSDFDFEMEFNFDFEMEINFDFEMEINFDYEIEINYEDEINYDQTIDRK